MDAAKALALGADIAGMAGNVLEAAVNKGEDAAAEIILQAEEELRMLMLLTGSSDIKSLRQSRCILQAACLILCSAEVGNLRKLPAQEDKK